MIGVLVTLVFVGITVLTFPMEIGVLGSAPVLFLRAVALAAVVYLVYETFRNWTLTKKASQGVVTVGFLFFIVEQLGFILSMGGFGAVGLFLAYEGRIMGLFILNAVLIVGMKKADPVIVLRRLGLGAPTHSKVQEMLAQT